MDTVKLKPRFDELSFPTSDPDEMAGRYLASDLRREWEDSFTDKNTGEVVSVTRSELVMRRGEFLSPDNVSSICFYLQCGEIRSVNVTNVRRTARCIETSRNTIWRVTVSADSRKRRYILFAQSLDQALRIAKDYLEQTLSGDIRIEAAKSYSSCIVIDESAPEEDDAASDAGDLDFFNISTKVVIRNGEQDMTWLVLATSVDDAKPKIRRHIDKTVAARAEDASFDASSWEGYELTVLSGTKAGVDAIIPKEFSEAYFKFEEAKKLSQDHDRVLKMIDKALKEKDNNK